MNIELIVFDIAGTTVADKGEIAASFQLALKDFGYHVPVDKINPLMGYKKPQAIQKILEEFEKDQDIVNENYIDRIHQKFQNTMVEFYKNTDDLQPLPFAEEIFEYLHNLGIKVALDTGFSRQITEVIIDKLGWINDKKIDTFICSDDVERGRPHPFMINKIMQELGINDSKKVIKVGDTEVDVNEGFNANCRYSIGITTGAFTENQLKPYNPSYIINNLNELIPIIENTLSTDE